MPARTGKTVLGHAPGSLFPQKVFSGGFAMKRLFASSLLSLSFALSTGCQPGALDPDGSDQASADKPVKACQMRDPETGACADTNCDDINQPYQGAGTDFTIHNANWTGWSYKITGFYRTATGWKVRGFSVDPDPAAADPHVPNDGTILGLRRGAASYTLGDMAVHKTSLRVQFCNPTTGVCSWTNTTSMNVDGLMLVLQVPGPAKRENYVYEWKFDSAETAFGVGPWDSTITGQLVTTNVSGGAASSLCKGPAGVPQKVVFQGERHWDPDTFSMAINPDNITITCEEGAIAASLKAGYAPWTSATVDGAAASMSDWQSAFVHMKVADYCGTGKAHTQYGTAIEIQAPLDPKRDVGPITKLEAIWSAKKAICLNHTSPSDYRRRTDIALTCPAIPDCDAATIDAHKRDHLFSGIP